MAALVDETYVVTSDVATYATDKAFIQGRFPQGNAEGYVVTTDDVNRKITITRTGVSWTPPS